MIASLGFIDAKYLKSILIIQKSPWEKFKKTLWGGSKIPDSEAPAAFSVSFSRLVQPSVSTTGVTVVQRGKRGLVTRRRAGWDISRNVGFFAPPNPLA